MISLTCTNCQTVLNIDDAFAGGVCRCQHCGTIQTVPQHLRRGSAPGTAPAGKGAKTLYRNRTRDASSGTGLDDLAEAVQSSSGLSGSGLHRAASPGKNRAFDRLLGNSIAKGALIAFFVVVALVVLFASVKSFFHHENSSGQTTSQATPTIPDETPHAAGPQFCGVKLDVPSVIYLIDRGDSSKNIFGVLKDATFRSIESLGPDRKFQIIFWNNGSETAYPSGLVAYATPASVSAARRALDEVNPFGQSDLKPSLEKAVAQKPSAIVIATAKGWDLDDAFVRMVDEVAAGSGIKLHCISIGGASKALQTVATKSGGEYREVTEGDLRSFAQ